MFRNICLIGLPHSGKTIIGKKLYKHLNKGFVDTDDIIRSKYKIPRIYKKSEGYNTGGGKENNQCGFNLIKKSVS